MEYSVFDQFMIERFNQTDWDLVTREDGSVDINSFLVLVGKKLNIALRDEESFRKSFVLIAQLEHLLGPFDRSQAISVAIMYTLAK